MGKRSWGWVPKSGNFSLLEFAFLTGANYHSITYVNEFTEKKPMLENLAKSMDYDLDENTQDGIVYIIGIEKRRGIKSRLEIWQRPDKEMQIYISSKQKKRHKELLERINDILYET